MKPLKNILKVTAAVLSALVFMAGCKEHKTDSAGSIPLKGEVTYDITYSKDLREINTVGPFLPRTLHGIYDTCNVKLSAQAPLGLAKMDVVLSSKENFVTIDFDKAQLLIELGELIPNDTTMDIAERTKVTFEKKTSNISGFMSHCVVLEPEIATDMSDKRIEVFFVPFPNHQGKTLKNFSPEDIANNLSGLGLVTAINVTHGESNLMMMLREVKEKNDIKMEDFDRPSGFMEASRQDVLAMMDLMLN